MEKNNKLFQFFIPVIAIIIIIESVVLVSGLEKGTVVKKETTETKSAEVVAKNIFDLQFVIDSKEIKPGKNYPVKLQALVKESSTIGAIDLAIKYDAKNFDINTLVFDTKLPKPFIGQVIKESGMILIKYLVEAKDGLTFRSGDVVSLATFNIKAKQVGSYGFEVATGNEDKKFVTMFIENTSVKAMPFTSSKLEVNVIK